MIIDESKYATGKRNLTHTSSYVEEDDFDFFEDEGRSERPHVLTLSANDKESLQAHFQVLAKHLAQPTVKIALRDLAYTLSEHRTHHYHRAYVITHGCTFHQPSIVIGTAGPRPRRLGLIFTGQGAQWPQMGKGLLKHFPPAVEVVKRLDAVLEALPDGPDWRAQGKLLK